MSGRPTNASVTDTICECKYLQRAADDPDLPIVFDERTNEYHYTYHETESDVPATLNIYHCPFCGGAAPTSKRPLLFHVVSSEEKRRLAELLVPIRSLRELIETLGEPNEDDSAGMWKGCEELEDRPSRVIPCRMLTYKSLSTVADVQVYERPDGTIGWSLSGKLLGGATA
jgi:hypothetical protein